MIKTRLVAKGRVVSFLFILVFVPIYFAVVLQAHFSLFNLLISVLGIIIIQNFYEVGYIQNDTETIKNESFPTIRLSYDALSYYEMNKKRIYFFRFLLGLFLSFVLLFLTGFTVNFGVFVFVAFVLLPTYLIYNKIRNLGNLFLHFVLTTIKFSSIQLLFLNTFSFRCFLLSILSYPIINFLDRAATPRFFPNFAHIYVFNSARALYYFVLLLLLTIFYSTFNVTISEYLVFFFFFFYRFSIVVYFRFKHK